MSRTLVDFAAELAMVDGHVDEQEAAFLDALAKKDLVNAPSWQRLPVEDLPTDDRWRLLEDLGLIAACNGEVASEERRWLLGVAAEMELQPQERVTELLALVDALAVEIKNGGEEALRAIAETQGEGQMPLAKDEMEPDSHDHNNSHGVPSTTPAIGFVRGRSEAVSLAVGELSSRVKGATKGLSNASQAAAGKFATRLKEGTRGLGSVVAGSDLGRRLAGSDTVQRGVDLARDSAPAMAAKCAANAASSAAVAAATSVAYAGAGGALLKAGVALGIASPPIGVVVLPAVAGVTAAVVARKLAAATLRKRASSKDDAHM